MKTMSLLGWLALASAYDQGPLTYGGVVVPASISGNAIIASKIVADGIPEAKCLDGTSPAIYFYKGTDPMRIIIHHEGGGWCKSLDDCANRATSDLGSSKHYPGTYNLQGLVQHWGTWYLSDDPLVNPAMATWSKVLFRYCDGGSWTGANLTHVNHKGQSLHFAGHYVLQAGIKAMLEHVGMADAKTVVVNGGSAGGLAVYHHADEYATSAPNADVVGLPDGGFFIEYGAKYPDLMRFVFEQMNSTEGLNKGCIAAASAGEEWRCILAQHAAPHISVPLFVLQGRFDSYQTGSILESHDASLVNQYGSNLTDLLHSTVLAARSDNAAFVDSCHHHTGGWSTLRAPLSSEGVSQAEAFASWFIARGEGPREWLQDAPFPCDDCCPCPCGANGGCTSCCSCVSGMSSLFM